MFLRHVICVVALLCAAIAYADRPNVILIMVDDLGVEGLSCYGSLDYQTPELDRMAAEGIQFTSAYSQPLCTPTRVQLMTGKYNFRNYIDFGYLDPDEYTFGDMFHDAGYRTGIFGKWQLSGQLPGKSKNKNAKPKAEYYKELKRHTDPDDWGFDDFCLWQLNHRGGFGDKGSRYWDPLIEQNGKDLTANKNDFGPDLYTKYLLKFVEENREQPFFAYYPMALTHDPFVHTPDSSDPKVRKQAALKDMVSYVDKLVGQIADRVRELGLAEKTLILFTCDNGTHPSIHTNTKGGNVQGGKGNTTAEGMLVPLIAYWPGTISPGQVDNRLIDFTDVLPTLAAVTKTTPRSGEIIDGTAFLNANGTLPEKQRDHIYCWYRPRPVQNPNKGAIFAQDHRYKLYKGGSMFDLTKGEGANQKLNANELSPEAEKAKHKLQRVIDGYASQGGVLKK
ncbi:sulfatase-like hydrolase/transferase [Calycomorphotria hydatis]|uniref:Arylsulfatase n=1 Tax=Calycomorphotria hydatis TaxID=2528027 RepID=A0A517TF33_9PLAN|nr:sulfatase-like hydrolase/transferase [Calycomorphotria hydatis]QDT66984.1 Arylsulfatase precursor [Calycomorphotria hydatis]